MTVPHYTDDTVTVYAGDCLTVLAGDQYGYDHRLGYGPPLFPDASVDAVVCDPPYGLEFMGRGWDSFRQDTPTSSRHIGERAGSHGNLAGGRYADGSSKAKVSIGGGGKRPSTQRCTDCGKRDQFNQPHEPCGTGTWERVVLNPHSAPPSMLAFQAWCEQWATECLRVLKPGGHLLAFGGTRTWHRLACAVEDAGFEIRDGIAWLYGSGFPKSLDVSKAIDRTRDDRDAILTVTTFMSDRAECSGITRADVDAHMGTSDMGGWWLSRLRHRCACPTVEQYARLKALLSLPDDMDAEVWRLNGRKGTPGEAWEQREVLGTRKQRSNANNPDRHVGLLASTHAVETVTAPATDAAREWQGWGTALKPAFEPIVVARKPLTGTVAANILTHGTGALNIDACRIAGEKVRTTRNTALGVMNDDGWQPTPGTYETPDGGRWPANVVLDESQAAALDQQSGHQRDGVAVRRNGVVGGEIGPPGDKAVGTPDLGYGAGGGASRYFYTAKADAGERVRVDGVAHPTVKPLDLMRWLVRLVTPPGGLVLDPFAGSGTTVEACILERFRCVAIEREPDYLPLITQRINRRRDPAAYYTAAGDPDDAGLFGLLDGD